MARSTTRGCDVSAVPTTPVPPRQSARRAALAVLLLGATAAVGAWRWPRGGSRTEAPAIGDDVCVVAPPTPYDPASGLALEAPREVPADARCPVCGMYPARARNWAAQVIFSNGDAQFFDSPLSLMMYLGNVAHYTRGRTAQDVVARYVSDMATSAWVRAQDAVYVAGSSARGPMRAGNLPAFARAEAAKAFAQRHGGRTMAWGDVDAALLRALAPNLRADHGSHTAAAPPKLPKP